MRIAPDLSQLKFDKVKPSILGVHVLYQQYHAGKPISGAWIRVDIDKEGKVYNVQNDLLPEQVTDRIATKRADLTKAKIRKLSVKEILALALDHVGGKTKEIVSRELVYWPHNGIPVKSWKLLVSTKQPASEWRIYMDAQSGVLLDKQSLLKRGEACGRVFDPNPVVVLNDLTLKTGSKIPDAAYATVTLLGVKAGGKLDGPYVSTKATSKRVKRPNGDFNFSKTRRAFKEVMVYYHIDRAQRYMQSLGFDTVMNHPIPVDVDGIKADNSYYSPIRKDLTFGTGGVDDAEDAEIILHEYGHAIQDDQVPGWGVRKEGMAMGEGFGDFLAASFFSDTKPALLKPTVGSWDAVAYDKRDPKCLRRLDSPKKYPRDMESDEHANGEMWSASLWELRQAMGRKNAERLVIAHHDLLTRTAQFLDAVNALLVADGNLYKGKNKQLITDVFTRRGMLGKGVHGKLKAGPKKLRKRG